MEMDYLGIHVKEGELMIDPAKISGIMDWPTTLTTIKEVRSTLGLLGYHRPWIPNFAKIAKPLTDLLQKGREFAWSELSPTSWKNRLMLKRRKQKMPRVLGGLALFVRPGVCLWGRVGKSRYRRGCPDDKIRLRLKDLICDWIRCL